MPLGLKTLRALFECPTGTRTQLPPKRPPSAPAFEACAPGVDAEAARRLRAWMKPAPEPVDFDLIPGDDGFLYVRPRRSRG